VEVSNEIDGTIIEYSGFFAYPLISIGKTVKENAEKN
jgi:hypothetical protein